MRRPVIGVLRGGPSREYDISLQSGAAMLEHFPSERYEPRDILIDRKGQWHLRGRPIEPHRALAQIDGALLALHGNYGEDGKIQQLFERHAKPFSGSGALASSLAMNKALAKARAATVGVKIAHHRIVHYDEVNPTFVHELFRSFPQPSVIKPLASGSSDSITIAHSYPEFVNALEQVFRFHDQVLIEEYIEGREATCGVIDRFRNDHIYTLPEIEIVPKKKGGFFDYAAKYEGEADEMCPGNFDIQTKQQLATFSKAIHQELGLRHYSRADFIVSPRGIYFLEVNTLPALAPVSLMPKALAAVGCSLPEFLDHVITLSLR